MVKGVTFHVFMRRKHIQTLLVQVIDMLVIPGPWILKRDYTVRIKFGLLCWKRGDVTFRNGTPLKFYL